MRLLLAALAFPATAFAEEYLGDDLIDHERLMLENADRVIEATNMAGNPTRSLDLGDGQSIICSDIGCTGDGPNSGLGCDWEWLTIVRGLALACSAPPGKGLVALERVHKRVSAHVALNAYPAREPSEIEGRYQWVVNEFRKMTDAEQLKSCQEELTADGMVGAMLEALSNPETVAAIEGRILVPGLPFIDPCH